MYALTAPWCVVVKSFWSWSQGNAGNYNAAAAACGKPTGEGNGKGENGTVRDEKDIANLVSAPLT